MDRYRDILMRFGYKEFSEGMFMLGDSQIYMDGGVLIMKGRCHFFSSPPLREMPFTVMLTMINDGCRSFIDELDYSKYNLN